MIASAASDGTVRLWSPRHEASRTLRGHTAWVYDVAVSRDGKHIASAGSRGDSHVRAWRRTDGMPIACPRRSRWQHLVGGHQR